MTVMMLFRRSSFAAVGALMMIVTVLASAIMMLGQRGKAARSRREARDIYLEYLETQREDLRATEARQLTAAGRPRARRRCAGGPGFSRGVRGIKATRIVWGFAPAPRSLAAHLTAAASPDAPAEPTTTSACASRTSCSDGSRPASTTVMAKYLPRLRDIAAVSE